MICNAVFWCPCLGITECDDSWDTLDLISIHTFLAFTSLLSARTDNKMSHRVQIPWIPPVHSNCHTKWTISPPWQFVTLFQLFCNILFTDSYFFLDILRWTHGPSLNAVSSCMHLIFVPKFIPGLPNDLGFNSTSHSVCSIHHLGHIGLIQKITST